MQFPTRLVRPQGLEVEFEVLANDAVIGPAIERGSWADHETALFRAHLVPGCRVVDLGANVGWFAVQAVLAGAEVHAFEPVPQIAAVAERNVQRAMERGRLPSSCTTRGRPRSNFALNTRGAASPPTRARRMASCCSSAIKSSVRAPRKLRSAAR